jgi:ASPIC and UnbV
LYFGLGPAEKIDSVEVRSPNGRVETITGVAADFIYTIVEGAGMRDPKPSPAPGAPIGVGATGSAAACGNRDR